MTDATSCSEILLRRIEEENDKAMQSLLDFGVS
jgi:hypothetical protein